MIPPRDASALTDVLRRRGRVELTLSGHVHMRTAGSFHDIPFATLGGNHFAVFPTLIDCPVPVASNDDRHLVLLVEAFRKILLPPAAAKD